jgi:hypothetical protein
MTILSLLRLKRLVLIKNKGYNLTLIYKNLKEEKIKVTLKTRDKS